jgi:precorrin-4/cobalt-precorrin-4 C11-methyltransferase
MHEAAMPPSEDLVIFARGRATMVVHLSINNLAREVRELAPIYGADFPVAIVYRASWPDEQILRGTLATIRDHVKAAGFTRSALILIGHVPGDSDSPRAGFTLRATTMC